MVPVLSARNASRRTERLNASTTTRSRSVAQKCCARRWPSWKSACANSRTSSRWDHPRAHRTRNRQSHRRRLRRSRRMEFSSCQLVRSLLSLSVGAILRLCQVCYRRTHRHLQNPISTRPSWALLHRTVRASKTLGLIISWISPSPCTTPRARQAFSPTPRHDLHHHLVLQRSTKKTICIHILTSCTYHLVTTSFISDGQCRLGIFLEHRHQCAFDLHVDRFWQSLSAPSLQQPHPALLDAMCLMGCYFSHSVHHAAQEPQFLQNALSGISTALQHNDRLAQIVQASCLIAVYFFSRGRILEGYYHSSTAARLAVSLGLHQIKPEDWYQHQSDLSIVAQPAFVSFKPSLQLAPSRDATEYAERVATFWQVFVVDRAWSVASGLPAALPDDDSPRARIQTSWPTSINDSSVRMIRYSSGIVLIIYSIVRWRY